MNQKTQRARQLRQSLTKSEARLWSRLRGRQVCGLKFRRQHPIGPYIADFACVAAKLVIERDGGCHDFTAGNDLKRALFIERQGWTVLRFDAFEVEADTEAVVLGIVKSLGLEY